MLALAASLAIVTLLVALAGRIGDTLAVAGVSAVAGVVSGTWNGFALSWGYAVFAILAGGVLALLVALLRANAVINDRRLALLRDLLELADRPQDVEQLGERILALLVPAFADAAALDSGGERVAARGDPGGEADRIALPLTARGEAFGALELALGPSGRRYSAGDRTFAELVSGRVAVVLDNAGLSRQAREAEQRLIAALDTLGEAVTMNGPDGRTVYAQPGGGGAPEGVQRRGPDNPGGGGDQRPLPAARRARRADRHRGPPRLQGARAARTGRRRCCCATSCARRARSAGWSTRSRCCAGPTARSTASST